MRGEGHEESPVNNYLPCKRDVRLGAVYLDAYQIVMRREGDIQYE